LELPNGIPSHDTFNRMFSSIKPEQFEKCFNEWTQKICKLTKGEVVAISTPSIPKGTRKTKYPYLHSEIKKDHRR
jgi:hypothetical protein